MNHNATPRSHLTGNLLFLKQFLRNPRQIGSVIPSSRFLERRIMAAARIASARTVVELGPGTGGTTAALLRTLPAEGRLLSIEINPLLYQYLRRIDDPRLIAHLGSACDLQQILTSYGLAAPDAVVSGIPFSTLSPEEGARVVELVSAVLAPGGRFVAYQVSKRVGELVTPVFGPGKVATEFRNIPPLRVFQWQKPLEAGPER